jgi:hypothetical protein
MLPPLHTLYDHHDVFIDCSKLQNTRSEWLPMVYCSVSLFKSLRAGHPHRAWSHWLTVFPLKEESILLSYQWYSLNLGIFTNAFGSIIVFCSSLSEERNVVRPTITVFCTEVIAHVNGKRPNFCTLCQTHSGSAVQPTGTSFLAYDRTYRGKECNVRLDCACVVYHVAATNLFVCVSPAGATSVTSCLLIWRQRNDTLSSRRRMVVSFPGKS